MIALLLACASPCPPGTAPDPAAERRWRALVAPVHPEFAAIEARICVGAGVQDAVLPDGTIRLATGDDADRAARLGHLLRHVRWPVPPVHPGPGCEDAVETAVAFEREALLAEAELRIHLDLPPLPVDALQVRRVAYARRCGAVRSEPSEVP